MFRSLLLFLCVLLIPFLANAQYQLNSFDELLADSLGYTTYGNDDANSTYLRTTIDAGNKAEGAGALRVEWQNQAYDQYGGWIGINYWQPDTVWVEQFAYYDSIAFWYYVETPQSVSGQVELRLIIRDNGPNTNAAGWGAGDQFEVWFSHYYVLDDGPGWNRFVVPLIDIESQTEGLGFWAPGWGQAVPGDGILDKDKIANWTFEFSQGGGLFGQPIDSVSGVLLFDNLELVGVSKVNYVCFNGKNVPGNISMHTGWSGAVEYTTEEDAAPENNTGSIKWTTGSGWDGPNWDITGKLNMQMVWPTDTLQFKIKAPAGLGNLTLQFQDPDEDGPHPANDDYGFIAAYTLTEASLGGYDGTWKQVKVALADFNRFNGVWSNELGQNVAGEFDSTKVVKFFITGTGQDPWAFTVYLDDIWTGNPEFDFNPPAMVTNVTGYAEPYYNLVSWDEVPGESGEVYSVYASQQPITDIQAPGVEVVVTGLDELTLQVPHKLYYPLVDKNVTYYYAVTCKDKSGNVGEAGVSEGITNLGKAVPTISLTPPANFVADGDLTEWISADIMPWVLDCTENNWAAGSFGDDPFDLTATVYLAMDDDNLYVACDVYDDVFYYTADNVGNWWVMDAFEFFIGLWDQNGKAIHAGNVATNRGAEPDYKLVFLRDRYCNEYKNTFLQTGWTPEFTNDDANYFFEDNNGVDYVIEASIPLDAIAFDQDARFHPANGMRIMFDLVFHDQDTPESVGVSDGNLSWSPNNRDQAYLKQSEWTYTWIGDTNFVATGIDKGDQQIAYTFEMKQNYPNPFNPSTTIEYTLAAREKVSIDVYNLLGEKVYTLVNQFQAAGKYSVQFDGANLSSGVYLYKIKAGAFENIRKMVLLK